MLLTLIITYVYLEFPSLRLNHVTFLLNRKSLLYIFLNTRWFLRLFFSHHILSHSLLDTKRTGSKTTRRKVTLSETRLHFFFWFLVYTTSCASALLTLRGKKTEAGKELTIRSCFNMLSRMLNMTVNV